MKMLLAISLCFAGTAFAQTHDVPVRGHVSRDGTVTQPHHRTAPNTTLRDNYSTQGNTNPYTGQQGHVSPYPTPTFGQLPQTPHTPQPTTPNPYGYVNPYSR